MVPSRHPPHAHTVVYTSNKVVVAVGEVTLTAIRVRRRHPGLSPQWDITRQVAAAPPQHILTYSGRIDRKEAQGQAGILQVLHLLLPPPVADLPPVTGLAA